MWKPGKQDDRAPAVPATPMSQPVAAVPTIKEIRPVDTPKFNESRTELAHIGKSVVVKGELSGSEDLYLDGEVEGTIELRGNSLTIGPNGRVRANVQAKDIVVHGKVNGNMKADRIELKKSALVSGDLATQRVVIEDGAFFKGGIDIQREQAKEAPKPEVRAAAAAASASPAAATPSLQGDLLAAKKP